MEKRRKELLDYIDNEPLLIPTIEEMLYLESELNKLRVMPKIKVNPKNPLQQKALPAAKLYKEYLQQYLNAVKAVERVTGKSEVEEESPLRKWVKSFANSKKNDMDS